MSGTVARISRVNPAYALQDGAVRIGRIVEITADHQILVDYPGNLLGPTLALTLVRLSPRQAPESWLQTPVLLAFVNGPPADPIIIGIVYDRITDDDQSAPTVVVSERFAPPVKDIHIDGARLIFDAEKEIVLRCGKGSITMRRDGKIVLKGTDLVSRASQTQKIKGASVNIN